MLGWASTTASDSLSLRSNGSIASMKDALTLSTTFLLAPVAALLAAETQRDVLLASASFDSWNAITSSKLASSWAWRSNPRDT
jgi:hypothetical protein